MKYVTFLLLALLTITPAFAQDYFQTLNIGGSMYTTPTVGAISSQDHIFVGTRSDGAIYCSTDHGANWTHSKPHVDMDWVYCITVSSQGYILAGTGGTSAAANGLYVSTDDGDTWTKSTQGLAVGIVRAIEIGSNGYAYASIESAIFRSVDTCKNWVEKSTGLSSYRVDWIASAPNGDIYAIQHKYLFKTTDHGENWTRVQSGLPNDVLQHIFIGTNGYIYISTAANYIYRSTNNGDAWTSLSRGLRVNAGAVRETIENAQGDLFAGSSDSTFAGTLYKSNDHGDNWSKVAYAPCWNTLSDFIFDSQGFLYARCGGALLKSSQTTLAVDDFHSVAPEKYYLHQNYPNPSNPSTLIQFDLPEAAVVTLKVYNIVGQEVATLVEEKLEAGEHTAVWKVEGVPSGVYFYRLQASKFSDVKKMILLR